MDLGRPKYKTFTFIKNDEGDGTGGLRLLHVSETLKQG